MKVEVANNIARAILTWWFDRGTLANVGPQRSVSVGQLLRGIARTNGIPYDVARACFAAKMKQKSISKSPETPSEEEISQLGLRPQPWRRRPASWHNERMTISNARQRSGVLLARYKEHCSKGLDILDLATDDLTSPWIVAECVIETICRVKCGTYEKKEKAKWLEGILQGRQDVEYDLGEICKDPSIGLQFPRLRDNVLRCCDHDNMHSPLVERIKHNVGLEYEYVLQEMLENLKVGYMPDAVQRKAGYSKTPDALLSTAIEFHGHVCYWIESKASFGDEGTMEKNFNEQFHSYLARYGPGAVIYWFDYVEDAKTLSSWREQGLIAIKAMPTPDSVVHRTDLPTARGTWAGDAQASLA